MIFRAKKNGANWQLVAFKIDPWERESAELELNPNLLDTWICRSWPVKVALRPVGHDGEYTLLRREVDCDREKRWLSGQKFQVMSLN